MTLYALHYQWIGDLLRPTPVGIWGEGGTSFYFTDSEAHWKSDWKDEIVASELPWAYWVKENVEYHSRDGASLRAIESNDSMSTVLSDVASKFFESIEPAQRFVLAQSWWVGAELVRRHPELILHESHPGGGQYDVLGAFTLPYEESVARMMLNRVGTLQVQLVGGAQPVHDGLPIGTWAEALGTSSPHEMVKRIE
jgi:hypothetical protein